MLFLFSVLFINTFYFVFPNYYIQSFGQPWTSFMFIPTFLYSYLNSMSRISRLISYKNSISLTDSSNSINSTNESVYNWIFLQLSYLFLTIITSVLPFYLGIIMNILSSSFLISNLISLMQPGTTFKQIISKFPGLVFFHATLIEIIAMSFQYFLSILYFPIYLIYLVIMVMFYKKKSIVNIETNDIIILKIMEWLMYPIMIVIITSLNWVLEQRKEFSWKLGNQFT